jgi:predicted ArsR family transcriptional regulator
MEAMQPTRKRILEMLRDCQTCTADSLAEALEITTVTVRHHLEVLAKEGLAEMKEVRHRERPGRPQHAWSLTPCALERFPKNYQSLSLLMLDEIKESLSAEDMQRISRGVASRMAAQAHIPANAKPEQRLKAAVNYLNECGYAAEWERHGKNFVLRTKNCPYHEASKQHSELCNMDLMLVAQLLGTTPERRERMSEGDVVCSYVVEISS